MEQTSLLWHFSLFFTQQKGTPMKGLQVSSPLPPYPTEPLAPPQGKKGTSALSALLEMEQKWVSTRTAGQHQGIYLWTAFLLLPCRTLDEQQQQQQAKPPTAITDPSSVATALTYVDSPRKVSFCSSCASQNKLSCFRHWAFADTSECIFINMLVLCCGALALVSLLPFAFSSMPVFCSWCWALGVWSWVMFFLYADRTLPLFWILFVALVPPTSITLRSVMRSLAITENVCSVVCVCVYMCCGSSNSLCIAACAWCAEAKYIWESHDVPCQIPVFTPFTLEVCAQYCCWDHLSP